MANINLLYQSLHPGLEEHNGFSCDASFAIGPFGQMDDGMAYANSSELSAPEYSTDDFRMFSFKVARCSKRYVHDWRCCPFAHPTENARRRDPRSVRYLPVPCPDYKRGICLRGDTCPYSHGVYECWLHPAKYKTQLCKEGPHCRRPVCFFAHSVIDLRQPTHLWDGPSDSIVIVDSQQNTTTTNNNNNNNSVPGVIGGGGPPMPTAAQMLQQSSSDATYRLQSVEEAFNNCNAGDNGHSSFEANNNMIGMSMHHHHQMSSGSGGSGSLGNTSPPHSPSAAEANNDGGLLSSSPDTPTGSQGDVATQLSSDSQTSLGTASGLNMKSSGEGSGSDISASDMDNNNSGSGVPALRPRGVSFDIGAGASDPVATAANKSLSSQRLPPVADALLPPPSTGSNGSSTNGDSTVAKSSSSTTTAAGGGGDAGSGSDNSAPWAKKLAEGISATAAMSSIPVNERPMLPSSAPRMSNAVARKLGLAPQKAPGAATAAAAGVVPPVSAPTPVPVMSVGSNGVAGMARTKSNGLPSPTAPAANRASLDSLLHTLHSAPSLEQQLALAMAQQQQQQHVMAQQSAGGRSMSLPMYTKSGNHASATGPAPSAGGYSPSPSPVGPLPIAGSFPPSPAPSADAMGIHPALLNLVAAHMTGAGVGAPGAVVNSVVNTMPMAMNGDGNAGGADPAAMAQLLQSVHNWNFANGAHPNGGGVGAGFIDKATGMPLPNGTHMHQDQQQHMHMQHSGLMDGTNAGVGGNGSFYNHHMPHRSSSDNMLGVSGLPQVPVTSPFYLPNDLDMSLNNQAGGAGEC